MNTKVIIFVDLASGNTPRMNLLDFRMCLSNRESEYYQNSNFGELENNLKPFPNENCAPYCLYNIHT